MMNREGRATTPNDVSRPDALRTYSGHRALVQEEKLIFELGRPGKIGVDLPELKGTPPRLGNTARRGGIGLPDLSEPEIVRHYVRLSQKNFSIDTGMFPLGSCTMKHNPRLNEKVARFPGFADIHPLQPQETVAGAFEVMDELARWLKVLTGMPAVAMSPKAGAHGELCGLMAIKAAIEARGEKRTRILVPESAHGTNPATAALIGFTVDPIPANARGRVDLAAMKAKLGPDVAAVMVTNPNTCGLFENEVREIADAIHGAGGYFYCDGANYNAIVGRVRPGDLGIDAMHINLHKTFSTPHGGGGPGAGPVVFSQSLAPFVPLPYVVSEAGGHRLVEHAGEDPSAKPFGRMVAFHGQMGMFTRALTYMLSHGADGLRQVAEDAVLNANYILASLKDVYNAPFAASGPCMHEALFDDTAFEGITTLDIAKALIDEGFHPMTVYFPLVVHGAMLVEPTETESKETLDVFIASMRGLAADARAGKVERFKGAPWLAPRARLDETAAARKPVLRWEAPKRAEAAE